MLNLNSLNNKGFRKERERGAIIIFTVLMLSTILAISLALAAIFLPKIRGIVNAGPGSVGAIYAADSAIEWCIYKNRGYPDLPQPIMSNGSTYTITPSDCSVTPLNHQAIGNYRNVSRSLQVQTL